MRTMTPDTYQWMVTTVRHALGADVLAATFIPQAEGRYPSAIVLAHTDRAQQTGFLTTLVILRPDRAGGAHCEMTRYGIEAADRALTHYHERSMSWASQPYREAVEA